MKEYYGESAKKFTQTRGKTYLLNPAIARQFPKAISKEHKILEVGCANAFLYDLVVKKGYEYYGLDISPEMIKRAIDEHPKGHYLVANSTNFSQMYKVKFSAILISQLFPAFKRKNDITKTLLEVKRVLDPNGIVLVGVSHPNFDRYMEKGLFGNNTVETDFTGYFNSGQKMMIKHNLDGKEYIFEDHHWTLEDYADCINKAGLVITKIDECKPDVSAKKLDSDFYTNRARYPTYILLVCK